MKSFRIKQLRVSGLGKEDGLIEFTDGLNIILGRSNTGKTWILKCLYYLFSSDNRPFSPLTGYTDIEGIFITEKFGEITIRRTLDETIAYVTSPCKDVKDGAYATNYKKSSALYLNDLWLRIVGIDNTISIPKNSYYERERLSWTNIMSVFYVDEDEISQSNSIVLSNPAAQTAMVSSLYYLITKDYKDGVTKLDKPEITSAMKKGRLELIDEQIRSLNEQKSDYIKRLEAFNAPDMETDMSALAASIETLQSEMAELMDEHSAIIKQIAKCQQEDSHCQILLDRYESLISQYKADLQRLDFISKGESAVKALPQNMVCPFCGGPVKNHSESYSASIAAEAKRIISELAVIIATVENVRDEQKIINDQMADLQSQKEELASTLAKKTLAVTDYKKKMELFQEHEKLQNGIDFVNEQLGSLGKIKTDSQKAAKGTKPYQAKKEFESHVGDDFDVLLNSILKDCNYSTGYASWDFTKFDILIDGTGKSDDQGKGYRSFLNSVVALMLYRYFNDEDVFINPGILIIDTPLLGLDEDEDISRVKTIKTGLYQYIISHTYNGQMIIVDNLNMVPDIDFSAHGINVVTYHKNDADGHIYGFLPSWRKDLPKETK